MAHTPKPLRKRIKRLKKQARIERSRQRTIVIDEAWTMSPSQKLKSTDMMRDALYASVTRS